MPNFFDEVKRLSGRNKLNAYALIIAKLSYYNSEIIQDKLFIRDVIPDIKTLFHNHEQSFVVLTFVLKQHLIKHPEISERLKLLIRQIIECVDTSDFQNYFKKTGDRATELDCRVARFFESHIAMNMIQNPSPKIWDCINKISNNIIKFIELNYNETVFNTFLANLGPYQNLSQIPNLALAFGRYDYKPSIMDIIKTLKERKDFVRTMLIHFMFIRDVYFCYKPDIDTQTKIKNFGYGGSLKKYIQEKQHADISSFFSRYDKFPLYQDRGRGNFNCNVSQTMGICINPQDRKEFPYYKTSWYPDCICQEADLTSLYTKSLILHDIPYVAGPSGMTTLLSASMLFMGQFESIEEHHYYILAIMAFITGGGLHSIHEVLTVPNARLGLIEFYHPSGPHAGNYNDFFNLFRYDELIMRNIDKAWNAMVDWFCRKYPDLINNSEILGFAKNTELTEIPPKPSHCILL